MITGFSGFEAGLFEYEARVLSAWPRLSLTIRTIQGLFWRTVPHPHFFTHVRLYRDLQHHHLADYSPTPTLESSSPPEQTTILLSVDANILARSLWWYHRRNMKNVSCSTSAMMGMCAVRWIHGLVKKTPYCIEKDCLT